VPDQNDDELNYKIAHGRMLTKNILGRKPFFEGSFPGSSETGRHRGFQLSDRQRNDGLTGDAGPTAAG